MAKRHDSDGDGNERGRLARKPGEIPARGWRDILLRVKKQVGEDNIGIVSAGVAYYGFLALFPAITATLSIYGLVTDPAVVESQLAQMTGFLPDQARELVGQILKRAASQSSGALSWGLALSILVSLWSARNGVNALFKGLNIAYDEEEKRGFFKATGLTLLFTIGALLFITTALALVVAIPAALGNLGLPDFIRTAVNLGRWFLLVLLVLVCLSILYRYAPDRTNPRWRWVTLGSAVATVFWVAGSWGFSFYVSNFGNYDKTYGSVAAVVILLFWLYLTSFIILLGAEFNAETESQTRKDSTVGEEKPMGKRRARHADELGPTP